MHRENLRCEQGVNSNSNESCDTGQLEALCARLLKTQPECEPLLKQLLARSRRTKRDTAFAPIQDGRCSACNMTIASARYQQVKAGEFINCAHCMRFLYNPH